MVRADLVVRFPLQNGEQKNWGQYDFAAVPRPGEVVEVWNRDKKTLKTLVVREIMHRAIEHPVEHPELESWKKEPRVLVIAEPD